MLSKVQYGVVVGALSASMMVQAQDYLPILQYHHVSETTPRSTSLSPEEFIGHMDYLESAGFEVVDLRTALNKIKVKSPLPEKAVAITFDDSYRDIYTGAFPILAERDYPFTVFINSEPVLSQRSSALTWDQMKEMEQSGAVFANHTINHPYMMRKEEGETDAAWLSRMTNEVDSVEELLLDNLGFSPKMLAYPYGESNQTIRNMINDRGIMAFGQQSGVVSIDSDFANLPRFPASGVYANLATLKTKLNSKPMPLVSAEAGGDLATDQPVSLRLNFKQGKYRLKDLACYVSGQGKATLDWVSETSVVATANKAFNRGRGRINCTMPDNTGRQYYWYSNVWIRPGADQGYVSEKS